MRRPTVIVTGLIGSGKSAVCALLRERGIPVYDCDRRTKGLYDRSPALVERLEAALGSPLRTSEGKLDRPRLAARIFSDPAARETLEGIVYPLVLRDFKRWRSRQKAAFVALESAVILSKPVFDGVADAVVVVEAPQEVCLARVLQRDAMDPEAALQRMAAQQIPPGKADVILVNDGNLASLSAGVERVFFDKNSYLCRILNQEV